MSGGSSWQLAFPAAVVACVLLVGSMQYSAGYVMGVGDLKALAQQTLAQPVAMIQEIHEVKEGVKGLRSGAGVQQQVAAQAVPCNDQQPVNIQAVIAAPRKAEAATAAVSSDACFEVGASSADCATQRAQRASAAISPDRMKYGMFPSEARAVVEASLAQKIDLLVESGTANGVSTELFARSMPSLKIVTIDLDAYGLHKKTKAVLAACCPNVQTFVGDSRKRLLGLGNEFPDARIGVMIDGPKGALAARLAEKILKHVGNVRFVAIHDTAPFWERHGATWPTGTTLAGAEASSAVRTWESSYRTAYASIDEHFLADQEAAARNTADAKLRERRMARMAEFRVGGAGLDLFYPATRK